MNHQFEISKRLSREHQKVTALLTRLGTFLQAAGRDRQPDWQGPGAWRVMGDLKQALHCEIPNHFKIEEQELFPILAQTDGADLVPLLLEDHQMILALAQGIKPMVDKTLACPEALNQSEWETLCAKGAALVTELCAHAEKEEFGFMPDLDAWMDPATASRVLDSYRAM